MFFFAYIARGLKSPDPMPMGQWAKANLSALVLSAVGLRVAQVPADPGHVGMALPRLPSC